MFPRRYSTEHFSTSVGFVAAAVSMPMGGCRARRPVEEFTDYDSVVVFLAVGPAYNAKFFVISH